MARADQLKALLRAYAADEDAQFLAVALQVAADEAQRGHTKVATEMHSLIERARNRSKVSAVSGRLVPLAQPKGELADLLTVAYPQRHLNHLVLDPEVEARLKRILKEQREHVRLSGHGLHPRRKILLVGPPGTGKTATASVLASELRMPLFTARFDSLITKFMGESASKLRVVFDALRTTRGVYLFDEFDSLGLQRGSQHDVAEMRRTLNMFLQLIEQDQSESLIVAATNHGQALDTALFRRFDDVIRYGLPNDEQIELLLRNTIAMMQSSDVDVRAIVSEARGLPHSDIVRACTDAMKDAVLEETGKLSGENIVRHLRERNSAQIHS